MLHHVLLLISVIFRGEKFRSEADVAAALLLHLVEFVVLDDVEEGESVLIVVAVGFVGVSDDLFNDFLIGLAIDSCYIQ